MKKLAISVVAALGACASCLAIATSAAAASADQDQAVPTMRNSLPTPTAPAQDDDSGPRPGSQSAFARDRNTSVLERPHPEYEALGVPLGGFTLYPKVTETAVFDDNVFANSSGAVGDWSFETKPEVRVESNWSRNKLAGFASVTTYNYAQLSNLNTTDYEVGLNGRYDVVGESYVFADAQDGRYTVPFTNLSVPRSAVTAEQYDLAQGDVGAVQELNRLRFSERFDAADYRYSNLEDGVGDVILENIQNHQTYIAQGKAEYAVSPDTSAFMAAQWNQRDYQNGGAQGVNSDGYELTVGASFDITHLLRGEAQVGYLQQNFDAAPLSGVPAKTVSGPAFHGKIEWFPSQLTTVTFTGDREIEDFTIIGASGTLGTGGGVEVDHELLRNLILTAKTAYNEYEYVGADRTDKAWTAGFEGNYLLNRHVGLNVSYRYMNQTSTVSNLNFNDNRVGVGLTLQY